MGESQHPLGATLGRLHAWRDRGSTYTEGMRTSIQAGILLAGVAKGAGFTDTYWAIALGGAMVAGLEVMKILAGWLDYKFRIYHQQMETMSSANPIVMRQLDALERLVRQGSIDG